MKNKGQGHLLSTKETAYILFICTHYSGDFDPTVTEMHCLPLYLHLSSNTVFKLAQNAQPN